jgi:ornithine cyclodeaminase
MTSVMTVWSEEQIVDAFDVDTAISSQRRAFEALGRGDAQLADKVSLSNTMGTDITLAYMSKLSAQHGVVTKLAAVHPDNAERGVPVISATVFVLDPRTGHLVATLAGTTLTTRRTAAGSAVAVDALALRHADVLAVLGSGVQAKAHVHAISRVRDLAEVRLHSRDLARGKSVAAELSAELGLAVRAAPTAAEAVRGAPIVATCTLSTEPVFATAELEPGATVISVGSFRHDRSEVEPSLIERGGAVVVDDVATAVEHAGPIVTALESGAISREKLVSLGDVLLARRPGRTDDGEIVFYNSVGIGVQDAAAAHAVLGSL